MDLGWRRIRVLRGDRVIQRRGASAAFSTDSLLAAHALPGQVQPLRDILGRVAAILRELVGLQSWLEG
jgi:hypothetical protein